MKHTSTAQQSGLIELVSKRRPQWLDGMLIQRPSSSRLLWASIQPSRWVAIGVILALHAIVISGVIYFNASTLIQALPPVFVGVIDESASPAASSAVQR